MLSQDDLGVSIGVSGAAIGQYERNEINPRKAKLSKLARALGVRESELLGYDFEENHTPDTKPSSEDHASLGDQRHIGRIPLYDAIAVGGSTVLADQSPVSEPSEWIDPGDLLRGATGALRVYGHSGFPKYPAGCVVSWRDADKELIFWGEDYVIETADRRIIKRLEPNDKPGYITAISYNKSEDYQYAPMEIPISKIKRLYMVLGKVELEASI